MKKLIVANWKLNPLTLAEAKELAGKIDQAPLHTAVLCPPTIFLGEISYPILGAQDVFWKAKGPYTGQTSVAALKSLGVKYCIVGHSERRVLGETDEEIQGKIEILLENGIVPVLCIGYGTTVAEDDMEVIDVLHGQLEAALSGGINRKKVVVAYEPVWALSAGPGQPKKTPTDEHIEKVALFIKTKYGIDKVLYGGSATSVNAQEILAQHHIDGLLVGGASLLPDDFNKIINTKI
jgi:triosephosphate isomerase